MDPVTQGLAGALCAQAGCRKRDMRWAAAVGVVAGMAPDLDVLIRSPSDSLLALEYHRHFSHALAFIPIGSLLVALILWPALRRLQRWKGSATASFARVYLWSLLGMASHGVLDAATSYGTRLYWPLTDERVAWNMISVIDPLFSVPLAILLGIAIWRNSRFIAGTAGLWAAFYLALGWFQQDRAEQMLSQWAEAQGISVERSVAKPAFANLILWRGLIDDGQQFHSLAVRIVPGQQAQVWPGSVVERISSSRLPENSRIASDMQRFEHFSDRWTFRYFPYETQDDWFIGDFRYAIDPASERPLWGIRLNPDQPQQAVEFERPARVTDAEREAFIRRLRGGDAEF